MFSLTVFPRDIFGLYDEVPGRAPKVFMYVTEGISSPYAGYYSSKGGMEAFVGR